MSGKKIGPKLLPPHMRNLPGEYVTDEIAEDKKIHELDPPHIVNGIIKEKQREAQKALDGSKESAFDALAKVPVNEKRIYQFGVDLMRARAILFFWKAVLEGRADPLNANLRWFLWFPDPNNLLTREIKLGNPPSNQDRPKHLRNLKLHIDYGRLPQRVVDWLRERGHDISPEILAVQDKEDKSPIIKV